MKTLPAFVLIAAAPALIAGCNHPVAPDPFNASGGFAQAGYALTIVSATPSAGGTLFSDAAPWLAQIQVTFERPAADGATRLVTCLARSTSTFLNSSCRDKSLTTPNGTTTGTAGVYSAGGVRAWPETEFVLAFVVSGELVPDLKMHEDEIGTSRLSGRVVAGYRVEHPLSWR